MKTYAFTDASGMVTHTVMSPIEQPGGVEVDFDMGGSPGPRHRFHLQSRQWVDTSTAEQRHQDAAQPILEKRRALLQESDWTDTASAPARLGSGLYLQWQTYRQALRDITAQAGYPFEVAWPTPPGSS